MKIRNHSSSIIILSTVILIYTLLFSVKKYIVHSIVLINYLSSTCLFDYNCYLQKKAELERITEAVTIKIKSANENSKILEEQRLDVKNSEYDERKNSALYDSVIDKEDYLKKEANIDIKSIEDSLLLSVDFDSYLKNYTRVSGWPSEFPRNLIEYKNLVSQTQFSTDQDKWKYEIAPWVWHHQGSSKPNPKIKLEKAAILVLVRNSELIDIIHSIRQLEDRYNHYYHYPYIFLNDRPFTKYFMDKVSLITPSNVTFSLIPSDHWSVPSFVDIKQAKISHRQLEAKGVNYATSMSYRKMCRFNSGFFYKHPLLQDLDFYWRLEPNVDFYCDISFDPFKMMKDQNKKYAFVIFLKEIKATIPSLWHHTLMYIKKNNIPTTNKLLSMLTTPDGKYNLCHFWSNFEIGSLNWFRSKQYNDYFEYLDSTGNFYYERWGDAPVHTLAAGILLEKKDLLFLNDIGYRHDNFARWPSLISSIENEIKCQIPEYINNANNRKDVNDKIKLKNFDLDSNSCLDIWNSFHSNMSLIDPRVPITGDPNKLENLIENTEIFKSELSHIKDQKRFIRYINGP
ncbi:Glycolipid 2-alpha-mannosyltransferase 2 [Smittium culicis]|uniref:Glycolipid 2-alpha-mannosyltransferase 2 n=1 Tax=Smittium culicis TaxID=133412 RepID=A0A1R1Y3E6_9FUNG|nr:Glycolipid 2-alpha-mannosyltransferase 2 [Smittium culicis]